LHEREEEKQLPHQWRITRDLLETFWALHNYGTGIHMVVWPRLLLKSRLPIVANIPDQEDALPCQLTSPKLQQHQHRVVPDMRFNVRI